MAATSPSPFMMHGKPDGSPLIVSVPHAGRYYPAAIESARAVPRAMLEQIEDRHADRLIGGLLADGACAIVATHARAWIDLNRGEEDRASARERGGLGLVPSRLGGRELWRTPVAAAEVDARLATIHRPYHAAIAEALAAARTRYGFALLIDCHSMPPLDRYRSGARIVIGDRHRTSADDAVAIAALAVVARHGLSGARNAPYAGAYTLARHGRPRAGIHAIQIEVDRSLYLDPPLREPAEGIAAAAALLAEIGRAALAAAQPASALAAE